MKTDVCTPFSANDEKLLAYIECMVKKHSDSIATQLENEFSRKLENLEAKLEGIAELGAIKALERFGVDTRNPQKTQRALAWSERGSELSQKLSQTSIMVMASLIVTGICYAVWGAIKGIR